MASPPGLAPLEVALDGPLVHGFPLVAAITIRADGPWVTLRDLPRMDWFGTRGGLGARLVGDAAAMPFADSHPAPWRDERPCFDLRPGEARRMIADIAPLLPRYVPEGVHRLVLRYGDAWTNAASAEIPLTVRRPSPMEADALAALASQGRPHVWSRWIVEPMRGAPTDALPAEAVWPARLHVVLRRLAHAAPGELPGLAAWAREWLAGLHAPEAAALSLAVDRALGAADRFAAGAAELREHAPYIAWLVDEIAEDRDPFLLTRYS